MQSENRILGNQLVVMSREDLDALVNEMAQNIVAAQTKNAQNDLETWMNVPEGERFITREEAAHILHVNFTTLWRWDKQGASTFQKDWWPSGNVQIQRCPGIAKWCNKQVQR